MRSCHGRLRGSLPPISTCCLRCCVWHWSRSFCWRVSSAIGKKIVFRSRAIGDDRHSGARFHTCQTLPKAEGERRTGDVILRLTSDVKTLRDLLVNHVQQLGNYGMTFVSTIAVMFWMNWQLTLLALIVVPFIYADKLSFRETSDERRSRSATGGRGCLDRPGEPSIGRRGSGVRSGGAGAKPISRQARQSLDASLDAVVSEARSRDRSRF